jgi:hypothetical protein
VPQLIPGVVSSSLTHGRAKHKEAFDKWVREMEREIEALPERARQMLVKETKIFSSKRAFARLIGKKLKRASKPRKWTPELVEEATNPVVQGKRKVEEYDDGKIF